MSCHEIGNGMASIASAVIDLYEKNQVNKDVAISLIYACRKGVHWCDGNEDEAIEPVVEAGYCGLCFEKKDEDELSNVFDNDLGYPDQWDAFRAYDKTTAHFFLCPECKAKVISQYTNNGKPI